MRIVTWNMGLADRAHRFSKSHGEAWEFLLALHPDVAFLQEAFPPASVSQQEGRIVRDPFKRWGSLIYAPDGKLEPFELPGSSTLQALPNYLAFGRWAAEDDLLVLASVHAPPRRAEGAILGDNAPEELRRTIEGPKFNDAIFAGLASLMEGRRFIVAGDWNTARRQRTRRDSEAGEMFFRRIEAAGWHDCTWSLLQDEVKTWFGPGSIKQDDHAFCDRETGARAAEVRVAEEAAGSLGLSDHAPLIVEFADRG